MDHIHRVVILLFALCASVAHSATETRYSWYGPSESAAAFAANSSLTREGACALLYAAIKGQSGVVSVTLSGTDRCQVNRGYMDYVVLYARSVEAAPSAGDVCDAMNKSGNVYTAGTASTNTMCTGGVTITGSMSAMGNGKNYVWGPFTCKQTGCTSGTGAGASPAPVADSPSSACKKPQVAGTVVANGVTSTVCYTPSSTTTGSSGTSTTTTNSGSGTSSGTSTTTTEGGTTTCSAGSCTTTTTKTTTGADGVPVTTTTSATKDQGSFCVENPKSPLCTSSSFAGSCTAAPVCDGDAIQCAVAAQTLATKCALTEMPSDNAELKEYDRSMADQEKTRSEDGSQMGLFTTGNALSSADFKNEALLGAPVDLADMTVTIGNTAMVIPWSKMNAALKLIGVIAQAVSLLVCARIVFKG